MSRTEDDKISTLVKDITGDAGPPKIENVVLGPATMERIAQAVSQDPNMQTALTAAIEGAGGEIRPDVTWKLSLRGILSRVER